MIAAHRGQRDVVRVYADKSWRVQEYTLMRVGGLESVSDFEGVDESRRVLKRQ